MKSEHSAPSLSRPRPAGARWILAGFGLLFLSWLGFMSYYVWKLRHQPPPTEPPPRHQPATNALTSPAGR